MRRLGQRILQEAQRRKVPASQYVIRKESMPRDIYFLQSGTVKMGELDWPGKEKIVHLLRNPAVIPFAFFSGTREPTNWSYVALTDCEVYILSYERLLTIINADGELAVSLMNWFSLEVHELLARLSGLERPDVRGKILAALKFLLLHHSERLNSTWHRVQFPVSHQFIASMVGARRESVTVQFGKLQRERIVNTVEFTTLDINRTAFSV